MKNAILIDTVPETSSQYASSGQNEYANSGPRVSMQAVAGWCLKGAVVSLQAAVSTALCTYGTGGRAQ